MRVHTKIVFDMCSGAVLGEEGYEYVGPVTECKGGGSSVNSVDYEYNDRMATLSEEQQQWAREYFQMWQQHYKPYEIAQARANMELLPYETALYKNQLTAASQLLPQQTEAAKQFLTSALNGVDVNERMGLATADAANAWKDTEAVTRRANARIGVNPNSGRYQGIQAALDTQKAAQLAGARTQARVGAEQENFERKKAAASLNATSGILQGVGFMGG